MGEVISSANLTRGMRYWHENKKNWPRDFHRQFYLELAELREDGITEQWWRGVLPYLRSWRAIRPLSTEAIRERGLDRLAALGEEYAALQARVGAGAPVFAALSWDSVAELYAIAHSIKGMKPPVFASKLCHFLMPGAFPVIDGDAVGLRGHDYGSYWRWCRDAWDACEEKDALVAQLGQAIGEPVADDYPWGPKITEICLIGQRAAAYAPASSVST